MFPNLNGEMAKRNVTIADLAETIDKSPNTVKLKLRGAYDFTLDEAFKIQQRLGVNMPIDQLFSKEVI